MESAPSYNAAPQTSYNRNMKSQSLNPNLVFVIPCYNCGSAIENVVIACRRFSERILLVNDGSDRDTTAILDNLPAEYVGWERNRGKGAALLEGFSYWLEREDWSALITMDSDGQHDPSDIPAFLNRFEDTGADMIVGRRDFTDACVPTVRRWANQGSSRFINALTGCPLRDIQCGFRLIERNALARLRPRLSNSGFALETEMPLLAMRMGLRLAEAPIRCIYNDESTRRSSWKPLMDSWRIAKVVARHVIVNR